MASEVERVMQETRALLRGIRGTRGVRHGASSPGNTGGSELSLADMFRLRSFRAELREGLTAAQRRVLWRLARGQSIATAALLERVHPERVRRSLGTPRFQRALLHERVQPTPVRELPKSHPPRPTGG
jgi:hypothetical protein